jgi:hypothetical protein
MNCRQLVIGVTASISVVSMLASAAAGPDQPCSVWKLWSESSDRNELVGSGANVPAQKRRATYKEFLDSFWSSIDHQLEVKKPRTVGDIFEDIQLAFAAASHQRGQAIREFGVTPRLFIDDFTCEGDCADRAFTMRELQHGPIIDNVVVQKMIGNSAKYGEFNVHIQFFASPSNYLLSGVLRHVKAGLSKQSPVASLTLTADYSYMAFSNVLQRALACLGQ